MCARSLVLRMQKVVRARRQQRIPAFGEWNYEYGGAGDDWPVTQYFDSAMQAGLVVAIPPSPKPAKKVTNNLLPLGFGTNASCCVVLLCCLYWVS